MEDDDEQTEDWEEETLESLYVWLGLVTLLVEMLLPLPLSVLVVEFLQPELAPDPTVTLLDTESWPGDWRSGESEAREGRLSPPPSWSRLVVGWPGASMV